MNDFAKRLIFFLILAAIAGSISLYYAKYLRPQNGPDGEMMVQCVAKFTPTIRNETSALSACECAKTELARQKMSIKDLLGGKNEAATKVGETCIAMSM